MPTPMILEIITLATLETAILINEFYFTNFKIILEENISKTDIEVLLMKFKVAIKIMRHKKMLLQLQEKTRQPSQDTGISN
jgi:hypothetical protein